MRQFNLHDFPQLTFKAADWDLMQQGEQLLIKQNEQRRIKRLKSITELWAEWKAEFDRKYWGSWSLRSPPAQWSKCSIMFLCICSSLNVASPPVSTFQNCASQLVASKPNLFIWKAVNLPLFRGCFQTCFLIMSVSVRLLSGELLSHSFVCVLFTEIGGMSRVSLSHAASISWFSSSPIFFFFYPDKESLQNKERPFVVCARLVTIRWSNSDQDLWFWQLEWEDSWDDFFFMHVWNYTSIFEHWALTLIMRTQTFLRSCELWLKWWSNFPSRQLNSCTLPLLEPLDNYYCSCNKGIVSIKHKKTQKCCTCQ